MAIGRTISGRHVEPTGYMCGRGGWSGRRRWAFTLPEVLATMLLIGIVMPVVMAGISTALASAVHARNSAQAATLGEAKLMELLTTGQWGEAATGGDFGGDWPQYRWSAQSVTRDFGASEIAVRVVWTERGVEQSLNLSTIAYDSGTTQGTSQ